MAQAALFSADALDTSKLRFIDVDGVRTRYYEDGDGPPLFLFSGGQFGSLYSLDAFSMNLPVLARDFHVFAVDKLGQGHTDNPKRDADYTFEALLEHTTALIRALDVPPAVLVGHSRGALLVARLALDHPELVSKLVLVDSSSLAPDSPMFPGNVFYDSLRVPPGPPSRESVRVEPDAQAHSKAHITDDFVSRLLEIAELPKFQECQRRMESLTSSVWIPSLGRCKRETLQAIEERGMPVPTLMVWGLNDRSAPLPLGLHLFERIATTTSEAEMHVLNETGHYSFREQYQAFNRLVRSFCLG